MLETGIKGYQEFTVTEADTAKAHKSGTLNVLATPRMAALMEETAWKSVAESLEPGMGTVGIQLNLEHLAPTPVGMKVWCETVLTKIDGRKLTFSITAFDETGKIGAAVHDRFMIEETKFQSKADKKKQK
ncbi:MAG: thioesterase family protein [Lachnospiraceae bacterium]|nr:thioesterase family protein [Lachnospiraceae bacterium]MCI8872518.1 thioesterase family protein [Lachnospiraceae bacterium]MCI9059913.1 thioesterase family protein [Lachnospiraceae bacterium]GFI33140.1 fluoroacetyl-CoA thioesterase [Lachnospiraceae bacterium]